MVGCHEQPTGSPKPAVGHGAKLRDGEPESGTTALNRAESVT